MANQIEASANLTNASQNVVVPGVDLSAEGIAAGNGLYVVGQQARYQVAAPPTFDGTNTTIVLTGTYAGATASAVAIVIQTAYTTLGLPRLSVVARNGGAIMAYLADKLDALLQGIINGTQALTSPDINGGTADSLTSLTVAADSDGNVARWVMSTALGGTGVEDGANTWAKIATFDGSGVASGRIIQKLIFESATVHNDRCHAEIVVNIYDSAMSLSKIDVMSIIGTGLGYDSFKLVQTTSGLSNPIELWIKKTTIDRWFSVIAHSIEDVNNNVSVTYNNNAAWQSTTPTGAVEITSDWAGSGQLTSTSLSNSTGTVYYEKAADGFVTVKITLATITTTTDGTTIFTMPVGYRHTFSGDVLEAPLLSPATAGNLPGRLRMSDAGVITLHSFDSSSTANWRTQFTYRARG